MCKCPGSFDVKSCCICCQYIYHNVSVLIKILILIYSVAKINTKPCKPRSRVLKSYWPTWPVQNGFYWPNRKSTPVCNFDPFVWLAEGPGFESRVGYIFTSVLQKEPQIECTLIIDLYSMYLSLFLFYFLFNHTSWVAIVTPIVV